MVNRIKEIQTSLEKVSRRINIIENNDVDYWKNKNYLELRAKREELYKALEKEQKNIDKCR